MMRSVSLAMILAVVSTTPQEQSHTALGTVRFETSCSAEAEPSFTRALALLHSFEFGSSRQAFTETLGKDPSCAIAQWGLALTYWGNPFATGLKSPALIEAGRASIERARAIGAKTERERAYIDAAAKLFDQPETDQHARVIVYRDAMRVVAERFSDDPEASTFYALALAFAADPADKTYADQLKAGAILEALWATHPDHPGLAHYIIHAYDVPALADRAVLAARRYGKIAPDAPHALHMPSHTFTRLGYWQESIDTNLLSAAAARKGGNTGEELHASDYLEYAYLQLGQYAAAKAIEDSIPEMRARMKPGTSAGAAPPSAADYAAAAIPARYALERGAWTEAAQLEVHPSATLYADAITWFARALGAGRSKDPALVTRGQNDLNELQSLANRLTQANEPYWAEQVTIQRLGASAWIALAQGQPDRALALLREAASREDRTEKSAVTPGPLAPAHEMLGEMLLELKRPQEAIAEFQKTMAKEPNRLRAQKGAAAAKAAA